MAKTPKSPSGAKGAATDARIAKTKFTSKDAAKPAAKPASESRGEAGKAGLTHQEPEEIKTFDGISLRTYPGGEMTISKKGAASYIKAKGKGDKGNR